MKYLMEYSAYLITCNTNMHVGSGDTTFGVVDNLVQRDPVTNHPTIHSPSLKGALREHFKGNEVKDDVITYIFGYKNGNEKSEDGKKKDKPKDTQGNYRFFSAHLLSIPVRSDKKPFFMATTPGLIKGFLETLQCFGITITNPNLNTLKDLTPPKGTAWTMDGDGACIEDVKSVKSDAMENMKANTELTTLFGPNLALFHEEDFKAITEDLPVIARNNLENGESKNLWYEEIVPHQTRFFFVVGKGNSPSEKSEFEKTMKPIIQIGANATIGYGYTTIRKINDKGGIDE